MQNSKTTIGVVGLGYVGLPLAISFAETGFEVIGIDIDTKKIQKINLGESYINHISSLKISSLVKKEKLIATNKFENCNN